MVAGAIRAPIEAPALNMDVANALSFLGKYSAVVLMAAGKLPDSPIASTALAATNSHTLVEAMASAAAEPVSIACIAAPSANPSILHVIHPHTACRQAPTDQIPIAHKYPFFVPIQSTNLPANSMHTAYMMEKSAVIVP